MMRLIILLLWIAIPSFLTKPANSETEILDARAIARIEGPIQGSGTLFKLDQKIIVLTAWHVLKSVREGEEVDIVLTDGRIGSLDVKSIKRIGNVDMAIANVSSIKNIPEIFIATEPATAGMEARVYGYPNDSSGKLVSSEGTIFSNANIGIDQGYQMIYSMETRAGMSGGPIIDKIGNIIGIHGRGELDEFKSIYTEKVAKTRLNNGVPISYFILHLQGKDPTYVAEEPKSIDDLNALAYRLSRTKKDGGGEKGIMYNSTLIEMLQALDPENLRRKFLLHGAYFRRSTINLRLNRFSEALADLDSAIASAHDGEQKDLYHLKKPLIYELSGQRNLAIEARTELIAKHPEDPRNYRLRGHGLLTSNQPRKALADFLKAIELGADTGDDYANVARTFNMLNEKENALKYIRHALNIDPQNRLSLSTQAIILNSIPGGKERALDSAQEIVMLSTKNDDIKLEALDLMVSINLELNNLLESEKALRKMEEHWPDSHKFLSASAWYYSETNQYQKAITQLTSYLNSNPPTYSLASIHGRRGMNWQNLEKYEKAISDYNKAISIGGGQRFLYSFRGHSFAGLGNFVLACADWRRSVKMGSEFDVDFINDFCQ